ncbi:MAG: VWA domain-containing protein [Gemmatimonadetes bacterium]|nr:VWA domain-containing protein [Gemmatimonadota bacterium]
MLIGLACGALVLFVLFLISVPKFANTRAKARLASMRSQARTGLAASQAYAPARSLSELGDRFNPNFNTESYDHIVENAFLGTAVNPLSTFSVDVDRAAYGNVRRLINSGQRPPIDAVRIEELVNYFPYDYPEPRGDAPFSITTEVAAAPWDPAHRLVRIGLKGRSVRLDSLPPSNLVFLVDVSGSMDMPDKLPLVQSALRLLVNALRPQDRVSIVVYAGAAGLVLPATAGDHKANILYAIDELEAGGSTAGGQGIRLAYRVAREQHLEGGNNRVILATDGDFNVGVSSDGDLVRLIEREREQGTFLTVLGFGTGNLKDSKMEKLADHGNGNYAYIDNLLEAQKVLVTEMGGTLLTIAKDVKIQVEFNPGRVKAYRLIGYENRLLAAQDFNDDRKDAGDIGAGHTVTALYQAVLAGDTSTAVAGVDSLRYERAGGRRPAADSDELVYVKVRYQDPEGKTSRLLQQAVADRVSEPSLDLAFAAAVAGFGMQLRASEHRGSWTMADVLSAARRSLGGDPQGYRREFVGLVEKVVERELLAQSTP